jgi:O-antigen/teichoic acid export membrane protein
VPGIRRDISWGYLASGSRIASWVVVYGALYRKVGLDAAALLALVRWTLGLLNYASAGLAPAIIHHAAKAISSDEATKVRCDEGAGSPDSSPFVAPSLRRSVAPTSVFHTGITLSWLTATLGLAILWTWTLTQGRAHHVAPLVGLFGTGILLRLAADSYGAVLQTKGRIRTDFQAQAALEILWATTSAIALANLRDQVDWQYLVGGSYLVAALITALARALAAHRLLRRDLPPSSILHPPSSTDSHFNPTLAKHLLTFGGLVVLSQLADFLYAPTDLLLIRTFIDLPTVAVYNQAIQVDAALALAVMVLANVLFPRAALAHAAGDRAAVRRYYVRGTLASVAFLIPAACFFIAAAPYLFKAWLGTDAPATRHILPLVLLHTCLGGSATVGRAILLATGRTLALTTSALLAGAANALVSFLLVRYTNLGLYGIILGTIISLAARSLLWMPWYVLRTINHGAGVPPASDEVC